MFDGGGATEEDEILSKLVTEFPERAAILKNIESVKASTRREKIEQMEEVTLGNKTVPLKTEKLKLAFKKVEGHLAMIQEYEEKTEAGADGYRAEV